jgi:hypothetical protein
VTRRVEADYLVVGGGATGMAFTDALVDHGDSLVVIIDRRQGVGGHWLNAYPFVRLHQASSFYGVASTVLGGGRRQERGPEAGLHERADQPTICAYYDDLLTGRMLRSGQVEFFPGCDYLGDRTFASIETGQQCAVSEACRIVDARYLAPDIPAETPPKFEVAEGARVIPVNDLMSWGDAPSTYVIVGSGKTATDACVWLLQEGVDPDAICWVRPRDPWMLNRAVIQPDPAIYLGMVADMMRAAGSATSLDDLFLQLEDAGIMLRVDRSVRPTMAKAPTLGRWELELLRSIENVVRLGHIQSVSRGRIDFANGSVAIADDALVVNCAADGLKQPPRVPIWRPEAITLQPIRAGFPCFGAALAGYVEATRDDDDLKNKLCSPSSYGNTLADWATMNVLGMRNSAIFSTEPDIKAWSNEVALNPARVPAAYGSSPELDDAVSRLEKYSAAGRTRLAQLAGPALV